MSERALAPVPSRGHQAPPLALPAALGDLKAEAEVYIASGLLPAHVKTWQQAVTIMQQGRELSIPPLAALRGIYVIGGKPSCNAWLMASLIRRDHGDDALVPVESTAAVATFAYKRRGWDKHRQYSYTMAMAKTAGLATDTWRKYPDNMLRARCISAIAMMAFSDSTMGMYTPEELGATVDAEGEVVVIPAVEPVAVRDDALDAEPPRRSPQTEAEWDHQHLEQPTRKPPHKAAMDRLHAIAADHAKDDAHGWLKARQGDLYPDRADESLTTWTPDMLRDFGDQIKARYPLDATIEVEAVAPGAAPIGGDEADLIAWRDQCEAIASQGEYNRMTHLAGSDEQRWARLVASAATQASVKKRLKDAEGAGALTPLVQGAAEYRLGELARKADQYRD